MSLSLVVYLALLVIIDFLTLYRWRLLSRADKQIAILIWVTTIEELIAYLMQKYDRNDMPVFHVYSPLELLCLSLYFNESVTILKQHGMGLIIAFAGIGFAIVNTIFLENLWMMNFNFLLLEGAIINVYCLFSFRQLALGNMHHLHRLSQFWITSSLLLYWSLTFTGWGMTAIAGRQTNSLFNVFYQVLATANYLFYATIALVFLFYPRLTPSRPNPV